MYVLICNQNQQGGKTYMKFGSREICDVVLKAKGKMELGGKTFYAGEPVLYFDTLKTSSLEGTSSVVYATGGKGGGRLMAWQGEKAVTFTMEDALASVESLALLSGADVSTASAVKPFYVHKTARVEVTKLDTIFIEEDLVVDNVEVPDAGTYIMVYEDNLEDLSEPCIPSDTKGLTWLKKTSDVAWFRKSRTISGAATTYTYETSVDKGVAWTASTESAYTGATNFAGTEITCYNGTASHITVGSVVLVDYYVAKTKNVSQIEVLADKFAGNFYLEASTLFRDTDGFDLLAEIVIPNCAIQSNFTIAMAATGDPSTFTFTMDAFPDTTNFDKTKKTFVTIQVVDEGADSLDAKRTTCTIGT